MQHPRLPALHPDQETEELVQFREAWKAEVRRKKAESFSTVKNGDNPYPTTSSQSHTIAQACPSSAEEPIQSPTASGPPIRAVRSQNQAVDVYRRAVELERQGQLDDALLLYRQAFKLDDMVDRLYGKEERLAVASLSPKPNRDQGHASWDIPKVNELSHTFSNLSIKSISGGGVTGFLSDLLKTLPGDLVFERETEQECAPLQSLPDEILVLILCMLDPTTIERFAAVSRKARVISLDSAIWREIVEMTYKPPQVPDIEVMQAVVIRYGFDFRRVFVEHPRVRIDGVYIAVCHYVRPGLSDNVWVKVNHLITYHRYLRFFPNGQVLSLLANEEFNPQHVIPLLKPTLRMKGLFIGTWHLRDTAVYLDDLIDAGGKYHHAIPSSPLDATSVRYSYQMILSLGSRPLGRWNKLDITEYNSIMIESGESVPISLKHERPFWFSKVRSYVT